MTRLLPFAVAIALPVAFTAVITGAVVSNRGETREEIVLTDQEVSIEGGEDMNSGARLWLSWSDETPGGRWASCEMLRRLGFECDARRPSTQRDADVARQLPRYAFVVLTLDGTRASRSRLVPIDADRNADALRRRYPDATRYLIVPAVVSVAGAAPVEGMSSTSAVIQTIDPRAIQVPTEFRADIPPRPLDAASPPIRVTVRYGKRWEPWVVAVH